MVIGTPSNNYAYKRNINRKIEGITYRRVLDFYKVINFIPKVINRKLSRRFLQRVVCDWDFSFNDFDLHKQINVLHFFNSISYATRPWVTTYETIVPRFSRVFSWLGSPNKSNTLIAEDKHIIKALKVMEGASCKKLIAMSENGFATQDKFLRLFPDYREKILKKMCVLHPPQEPLVSCYESKELRDGDPLRFIFIGHDFFRKGGCEILRVFEKFRRQAKIELVIISALRSNDYIFRKGKDEANRMLNLIRKNANWITYYSTLPYPEVLTLIKQCHIGLLPTWADTYGYSVLEFQAAACPVISTDIRVLPEINNSSIGWLAEVPQNELGNIDMTCGFDHIKKCIEEGLESALTAILDDPESVAKKGKKALDRIRVHHSPEKFAKELMNIYAQNLT